MNVVGSNITLTISEPWNSSRITEGTIAQQYFRNGKTYLLIEDSSSIEKYVVSNRYIGDDVTEVILGKTIIVAIALLEKDILSYDESDVFTHVKYFGIGSIELHSPLSN
jgi:hypothetical protein